MNVIAKFWKERPILFLIVAAIVIYFLYKWISGIIAKQQARNNYNATVNQTQDALNQLGQQGVKPSFGQAQYSTWADELQQAFSGCGNGWTSQVKPIFEAMKNDADIYALIQNYGVRKFDECGWGTFEGDLGAAIGYKFSGYRFCDCIPFISCTAENCGSKSEINKILKSKSIVFQF